MKQHLRLKRHLIPHHIIGCAGELVAQSFGRHNAIGLAHFTLVKPIGLRTGSGEFGGIRGHILKFKYSLEFREFRIKSQSGAPLADRLLRGMARSCHAYGRFTDSPFLRYSDAHRAQ